MPATALSALGLGTYKLTGPEGQAAVERALALGYRHLDTAQAYGNEAEAGAALRAAAAHGATPAQVLLAWHRQSGRLAIPRSGSAAHLAENLASLELELTADELAAVDAADSGRPARQDPLEFGI